MQPLVAPLNYLAPGPARVRTYAYDPPDGGPRFDGRLEAHAMTIADARVGGAGFEACGFALCRHQSAVRDFWDPAELLKTAYPEAEALVRELTGARFARAFDHTLRRRAGPPRSAQPGAPRGWRRSCSPGTR